MSLASFRTALRLLACAGFLAALAGCASSHTAYLQDGRTAYLVQCNGVFGSWSGCAGEAAERCATGSYQVLARNDIDGASEAQAEASVADQAYRVRNLLVQCQGERFAWRVGTFVRRLPVSEG
ncbi:hypothetical protein [Pseudomonas rhizoryzae]|uniref:hypothetical protein n=1 Tax=Pseudomonas rhizoryzae TaxID=2571129 RepID=UPI0007375DFC|nr:hypothetical protein [Pseudomonas rhizoryzae]KTT33689.1 hypothetical protein SB9_12770 [Pseudomonas psychrotolerans]KTT73004.1 hypothetical protein SB18R_18730 [Pseudomonas psychrotolerans]